MTKRGADQKQEESEMKIFPVPLALGEIEKNITINSNTANKPSQKQIIEQALKKGIEAHQKGKLQEAELFYRAILQSQPLNPIANHNLGVLAVSVNKVDAALPLFKSALAANPKKEQFWLSYIDALIKEEQNEIANQVIQQAKKQGINEERLNALKIQLKPTNTELNKLLLFYQKRQFDDAEKLALSITERFPNHPFSWKVLGASLKQTGRIIESLIPMQKAVQLAPQDVETHSNLGITLKEVGRLNESEASHKKAIALQPDLAEAHFNLGITLKELGKAEEAQASYKKAIALRFDYAEAHNNLGVTLKEMGKLEEAKASYKQAIKLKPDYANAHSNLGLTLRELGGLDESEASHKKAIALKPDIAEAHFNLGVTLKEMGKLEEAKASYKQAIELKPDYAEAHSNMGNTLKEMGKLEESVSSKQKAFAFRSGIRPVGDKSLAPATTSIFIEITNKCNFHCAFCPSDSQKRALGFMDLELVKQLYEENSDKQLVNLVDLHLMGEPTLHPELIEILKFGSIKKVKTNLTTNISTLGAKNVSKILDTLYGTITASHMTPTEETYFIRGAIGISWERYIGNLRLLVREYMKRLKKRSATKNNIDIRVMVTQDTASNVSIIGSSKEAGAILKEWNEFVAEVENELGLAPFKRKDHNDDDLVRQNNHSFTSYALQQGINLTFWKAFTFANTRVNDDFNLKAIKETSYCDHPFTDVGVLWNGDVTLCCLNHDGQLKVGNIRNSSIEAVIQSEAAQKLRASMLGKSPLPSTCQTCQGIPIKRERI